MTSTKPKPRKGKELQPLQQLTLDLNVVRDFVEATPYDKSNTFDIFDTILTFSTGRRTLNEIQFLDVVKAFGGKEFRVQVTPAAIKIDGRPVLIFPGKRESLVEKTIRKIAAEEAAENHVTVSSSTAGDPEVSVGFSIYRIRQILKEFDHALSHNDIVEALEVLHKSTITITCQDDKRIGTMQSGIIQAYSSVAEKSNDPNGQKHNVIVKLHPLVTRSMIERSYRTIDFEKLMRPKSELARTIYSKISHNFTQANKGFGGMTAGSNCYNISLSTLIRENGIEVSRKREAARMVREALSELQRIGVLATIGPAPEHQTDFPGYLERVTFVQSEGAGRKAIDDVVFCIYPAASVTEDIIKTNIRLKAVRENGDKHGE